MQLDLIGDFGWLLTRWWFWLTFVLSIPVGWYLFSQRTYKEVGGNLLVKHGKLGKWIDVEEHMKEHHRLM